MIELMLVISIIGVLASIAIPIMSQQQHRAKTTEAKTNLSAIRVVEEASYSESAAYRSAAAEPAVIPGPIATSFDTIGSDFASIGWSPEGRVFFSYAVEIAADGTGFTADAGADIDGDGLIQLWGFAQPDGAGGVVAGGIGCDPALLTPEVLGYCTIAPNTY